MMDRLYSILDYLRTDIWSSPTTEDSPTKAALVRKLKVFLFALRRFQECQCALKASALTFYSVLSVVPLLAMLFGIAKGFGFEEKLQAEIMAEFAGQEKVFLRIYEFTDSLLKKTKGGVIAGVGIAFLFLSVVRVLGYIEESFNEIWKVERSRGLARRFSDYLSVMLICPVVFVMASSVTVTMASQVQFIADKVAALGLPAIPILLLLDVLPFFLIWGMFSFVFIFMPNTKVRWRAGIAGAIVTGTIYQVTQWAYVALQVGVSRANAIYGSFAALPLFMTWMQLSWMIVLAGSVLSYAVQNLDNDGVPPELLRETPFRRKVVSLLVARLVIRNFFEGEKPLTASRIANTLGIPLPLASGVAADLTEGSVFSAVAAKRAGENAFQPARDIRKITVKDVIDAMEKGGSGEELQGRSRDDVGAVLEALREFDDAIEKSPANRLVIDL